MIDPLTILPDIVKESEGKIVLLILDGVGGLPFKGKTALEVARTPNLDKLAKLNSAGLLDPIFPGITPGSGPAHLSLFGYDPIKYQIGRGILEALGVGMEVSLGDLTSRGNFCIVKDGIVTDRRASRIPTEVNKKLVEQLNKKIKEIDGIKVSFMSGEEHRFVIRLRGDDLSEEVTDTDPHVAGEKLLESKPRTSDDKAIRTANIINKVTEKARNVLKDIDQPPNGIILRGISGAPKIPQFPEIYKLKSMSIATYPMYLGLTKLIGMDVKYGLKTIEDEIKFFEKSYNDYDYFYIHIKKVDSYGEDGNFEKKVEKIEEVDKIIPRIMDLSPAVLAVTGDHSTPATYKAHSWHPVPVLIVSKWTRISNISAFNESECAKGDMGRIPALYLTSLLLAHSQKLDKFGA
ncbi:2,3-bisphosphoglycerate-independent phosphoglycerate mutase [candidate division WOR-3 bacterium]|nr:2,3-bisphosphoglycerate-independent phosphoglycerate mutase [candidate division WOR-3 bacterium]